MGVHYIFDKTQLKYWESFGLNMALILKKSNIPINAIDDGFTLNKEQYVRFMETIDDYSTDEQLSNYGDIDEIMMFLPPLFAAMCSRDGVRCYNRISKYKKLIGPFLLHVEESSSDLTLRFAFDDGSSLPRCAVIGEQLLMINIIRKATGKHIVPKLIGSQYSYGEEIIDRLGIRPIEMDDNIIVFDIEDAKEPYLTENNTMWEYLEPELSKRLEEFEVDETTSAKVRTILFELIPAGDDSVDHVAKELALSVRSLQRKLSEENTTFIKQLNHTRELLARNYLKNRKISNDEIAFLIGYSDANAFQRAFKKWTGMTVGNYRKEYA